MVKRLLLPVGLLVALTAFAQVVVEEVGALQEAFNSAQQEVQNYRFAPALQKLDPVVQTLSGWESEGRLQPADEALLQKSLELRAIASFNLGKVDEAKADLAHLVRLKPESTLAVTASAKLQRLFEEIRAGLAGSLALQVEPPEAQVKVDGRALSGGIPPQLPLLKGLHRIEVSQPGYEPVEQEISVEAGQTQKLDLKLVPNARTIYFFVQPQGASLIVDGRVAGKAETRGDARSEWASFLSENSFSPAEWWAIQAANLPPGEHRVELRNPCYAQRRFTLPVVLDKENNLPGLIKPLALERRTTRLTVASRPVGAEIVLDGVRVGVTPLELPGTCVGEHNLVVRKSGIGEYNARLLLPEEENFVAEANLRPTLVWAGLTRDQETTPAQRQAAEAALVARFTSALTFNGAIPEATTPLLPDTFFAPGVPEAQIAETAEDLCKTHGAQGLLSGKLMKDDAGLLLLFRLLLPGVTGADEFSVRVRDAASAGDAMAMVDAPLEVRPREFVLLPDGERGLRIVEAPVGAGAPRPGERLLSVDSVPVATSEEVQKAFAGREKILLRFLSAGVEKSWLYAPLPLPPVRPAVETGTDSRRQWLLYRQEALSGETDPRGMAGRLGAALAALRLGRPADAIQILEGQSAASPAPAAALRPASLAYLKGVALHRLGKVEESRAALQQAAADPQASLDPEGEFPVQPLARHLLSQLPAPPPPPAPTPAPVR